MWSFDSFKSVTDAKFEPGEVTFQWLMPRTAVMLTQDVAALFLKGAKT